MFKVKEPAEFEVSIKQDDNDVNILVNGKIVAWFKDDGKVLVLAEKVLDEIKIGLKRIPER